MSKTHVRRRRKKKKEQFCSILSLFLSCYCCCLVLFFVCLVFFCYVCTHVFAKIFKSCILRNAQKSMDSGFFWRMWSNILKVHFWSILPILLQYANKFLPKRASFRNHSCCPFSYGIPSSFCFTLGPLKKQVTR